MKRNIKLQQAKVFIQKQIIDLENMLEILDEYDSLMKTVELQEQKIKNLEKSIGELDDAIMEGKPVTTTFTPSSGAEHSLHRGLGGKLNLTLPVRSAPVILEDYDAIEAAAAKLEENMV